MDDPRIGRVLRAIRQRLGWRQSDVAARAGVAQDLVSRIERGRLVSMPLGKIRRVAAALDADVRLTVTWRGGDLDRVADEGHALLVGRVVDHLRGMGWKVWTEVSFSIYGERGSIDVFAWHGPTSTVLVVEIKSDLTSVEETVRRHDAKSRLAPRIAREQFGLNAAVVGRLLVLPDLSTPRRRVERHSAVLSVAYPVRASAVRSWLRTPIGEFAGLAFLQMAAGRTAASIGPKRIRKRTS